VPDATAACRTNRPGRPVITGGGRRSPSGLGPPRPLSGSDVGALPLSFESKCADFLETGNPATRRPLPVRASMSQDTCPGEPVPAEARLPALSKEKLARSRVAKAVGWSCRTAWPLPSGVIL